VSGLVAWQGTIIFLALLLTVAVVVVVLGWQRRARAALARADAYRELSAEAAAAQRQHAAEVAALTAEVSELKRSLAAIERMMREVG
jgi:Tfp pilus assembly protein PilO